MGQMAKRVGDKRLLKLIRAFRNSKQPCFSVGEQGFDVLHSQAWIRIQEPLVSHIYLSYFP
jgi:hypothetical protein